MKEGVWKGIKRLMEGFLESREFHVEIRKNRPKGFAGRNRYAYQTRYIRFDVRPGTRVLDIGSGDEPFPYATILVERFLEMTEDRTREIVTNVKPLVVADIHQLPFADKAFDFVYCSHALEHVADPIAALSEIMLVGKRGHIETPTYAKDILFTWAEKRHKWHVVAIADLLVFFEYSERQLQGIRSSSWHDIIYAPFEHPLQGVFHENMDIFNTMLSWNGSYRVIVCRLDGSVPNGQG